MSDTERSPEEREESARFPHIPLGEQDIPEEAALTGHDHPGQSATRERKAKDQDPDQEPTGQFNTD